MMKRLLGGLAAMLLAGAAQAQPVTADVSPDVVSSDAYPKLTASYPGAVKGHADLVYLTKPGFRPLTLDVYAAPGGGAKPLVIYIHGGGWMGGTSRNAAAYSNFPAVLANLASRGYVVASVNYRLSGEARFPAAAEDVDAAIRWLKANAATYGIDKSRVGVWGGSAGGQLAGLAATNCSAGDAKTESDCVQAAVIWYGVLDFATLPQRQPAAENGYLGCKLADCPDQVRAASPVSFVDANDPPTLLIAGTDDKTVPVTQSREMIAKLKAAGVRSEFIELPETDHSFIGKTPEATKAAHLKALQATFDWFDGALKK